jgi:hypothetical protein
VQGHCVSFFAFSPSFWRFEEVLCGSLSRLPDVVMAPHGNGIPALSAAFELTNSAGLFTKLHPIYAR